MQGGKENGSVCLSVSSEKFQHLPWSLWPAVGAPHRGWGCGHGPCAHKRPGGDATEAVGRPWGQLPVTGLTFRDSKRPVPALEQNPPEAAMLAPGHCFNSGACTKGLAGRAVWSASRGSAPEELECLLDEEMRCPVCNSRHSRLNNFMPVTRRCPSPRSHQSG